MSPLVPQPTKRTRREEKAKIEVVTARLYARNFPTVESDKKVSMMPPQAVWDKGES